MEVCIGESFGAELAHFVDDVDCQSSIYYFDSVEADGWFEGIAKWCT